MQSGLERQNIKQKPLRYKLLIFLDTPGIGMYARDGELTINVLLPEFNEHEVEVTASSDGLEINAVRSKNIDETGQVHEGRQSYWRRLNLPPGAKPEAMTWAFRNGILKIGMPIAAPFIAVGNHVTKREEDHCGTRKITSEAKGTKAIGFRDQEFPNHWTRYRPVR